MNPEVFLSLSFYAHVANLMFVFLAIYFVIANFSYLEKMSPEKKNIHCPSIFHNGWSSRAIASRLRKLIQVQSNGLLC